MPVSRMILLAATALYAFAAPAAAQSGDSSSRKKGDPNEVVCEKQEVLGSRLAVKRVCMTRAQWSEQRRADRSLVERSQLGSCQKQSGC